MNESAELPEDEFDADMHEWSTGSHLAAAPDIVEVRRNGGVAGGLVTRQRSRIATQQRQMFGNKLGS